MNQVLSASPIVRPGPVFVNVADREILEIPARRGAPAPRRDFPCNRDHDPSGCLFRRHSRADAGGYQRGRDYGSCPIVSFTDGRRPSYHPSAEGSCEPDRVRFTVEIDMNHDSGAIAAVAKPVWLDPLMIEPCTHLRHRVDQLRDRSRKLRQCTASHFPGAWGLRNTSS